MDREKKLFQTFPSVSNRILQLAEGPLPRFKFLNDASRLIMGFSEADFMALWIRDKNRYYRYLLQGKEPLPGLIQIFTVEGEEPQDDPSLPWVMAVMGGKRPSPFPLGTARGSCWRDDLPPGHDHHPSLALIPVTVPATADFQGLLQLASHEKGHFTPALIHSLEGLAQTLGITLLHRRTQIALGERVKELTCLCSISQVVSRPGLSLDALLLEIVKLLPPGWLYPHLASARILLDGKEYASPAHREGCRILRADIVVDGAVRGFVEVSYAEGDLDEEPFLQEERSLIDAVAGEVALILERRRAEEERIRLLGQLRHADRLATIGQLAAGVAHEINEPLSNILGFAQLALRCPALPAEASRDLDRIVKASLHAREIIRKLMLFSRQNATHPSRVNLNRLVEEGLYFFESRCAKERITLDRRLAPGLPDIWADPAQLTQVLVNLVVNATQSMPQGGRLTIKTSFMGDGVSLSVEDNGQGMSAEVQRQIFLPFFTTKDVGQGTGLGLSVVHGIVASHGGSIQVRSQEGQGTEFTIYLPVSWPHRQEEDCPEG